MGWVNDQPMLISCAASSWRSPIWEHTNSGTFLQSLMSKSPSSPCTWTLERYPSHTRKPSFSFDLCGPKCGPKPDFITGSDALRNVEDLSIPSRHVFLDFELRNDLIYSGKLIEQKKQKLLNITRNYSHFLLVSGAFPWACCWHQHRWEPGAGLWKTHGSSLRQPSTNSGFSWIFHTELLIYPMASLFAAVSFLFLFCEDSWHQMLGPGWEVWHEAKRCVGCLGCFIYRVFLQQTSLPFPCCFPAVSESEIRLAKCHRGITTATNILEMFGMPILRDVHHPVHPSISLSKSPDWVVNITTLVVS